MRACISVAAAALAAIALPSPHPAPAGPPEIITLDNGARVVLVPVPGTGRVGMESVYDCGFFDEPAGMTQAAHLIEHCVCMGATAGAPAGARWAELSSCGTVNAETLPDFTHYDYDAPAAELERILTVEAERLSSLSITPALVAQEAPRVYAETTAVESNPVAPLMKHAFMAAHQAWRYGARDAQVRGGLEAIPIDALAAHHAATHRPDRLTLVIVGDFEPGVVGALVRRTVGAVGERRAARPAPIDWSTLPRSIAMTWDTRASAVILAYPPPADPCDRMAITLFGELLAQRLSLDADAVRVSLFAFASNTAWPVDELPFFVYATVRPGVAPDEAARVIAERAEALAQIAPTSSEMAMLGQLKGAFWPPPPTGETVKALAENLARRQRGTVEQSTGLVLLNHALQLAMRLKFAGNDGPCIDRVTAMGSGDLRRAVEPTLRADRRITTILAPAAPK